MNTPTKILLIATLLAAASPGIASPYIIGSIGKNEWKSCINDPGDSTSLEMGAGYQFTDHLAMEASYVNSGDGDSEFISDWGHTKTTVNLSGFSTSVVGTRPINEQFSFYGKAGLISWKMDLDLEGSGPGISFRGDGIGLLYGAGVFYAAGNHLRIFAEYRSIKDSSASIDDIEIEFKLSAANLALGARYLF